MDLVKFLVLEEYMGYFGGASLQCVKFEQAGSGVHIRNNGQQAKVTAAHKGFRTTITGSSLASVCYFKCKICHVNHWMFVGVGADLALDADNCSDTTVYGWAKAGQQCTRGMFSDAPVKWANGDWVLVKADFPARKLSMVSTHVSTPLTMSLRVPASLQAQYVFQVILYNCNDQVELLPVTAEDQQLLP